LLASASGDVRAPDAFREALAIAGLSAVLPLPDVRTASIGQVEASLERLDAIEPLAKPALLKACVAAVRGPAGIRMQEAELLRAVAAAVDCPLPPFAIAQ
jgi:hypothetical protein